MDFQAFLFLLFFQNFCDFLIVILRSLIIRIELGKQDIQIQHTRIM